ncbi:MAG: aldo/keto reductase [Acidimicrobiales bacterium]
MIEIMPFGRTGHDSTRVIFGAAALGGMSQGRADATLELVSQAGINHIDTARSYGESELRLAPWLADHRHEVFLASKTGERTADGARRQLEESLQRLGVDHIDLIQLHNLVEDDEFEVAHGPGGVVEAMVAARDEGLVRFIGVTGHGLRIAGMHLRSLERFDFDSVLFPYNFALMGEPGYRSDVAELRTVCTERQVAMQTIKSIARGRWPRPEDRRYSWYEPLTDPDAIALSVRYVLGQPDLFLNTSSDATLLPAAIAAAQGSVEAPSDDQMQAMNPAQSVSPLFDGGALERI